MYGQRGEDFPKGGLVRLVLFIQVTLIGFGVQFGNPRRGPGDIVLTCAEGNDETGYELRILVISDVTGAETQFSDNLRRSPPNGLFTLFQEFRAAT